MHVNKPASAAHGYAPETGRHGGNPHATKMAGAVPAGLEQVAQGSAGNRPSAGLMDAINAAQSTLGNRNFLQLIEAGQQRGRRPDARGMAARAVVNGDAPESLPDRVVAGPAQAAPVSIHADEPLQMMWRNPARRGLPASMNTSILNRDRVSRVQPAPGRNLLIRPEGRRQAWNKDILFGVNAPGTLQLAVKQEAATDSAIPRPMFKLVGRHLPFDFPAGHLWDKSAYNFADRDQLARRDVPYMAYAREVVATALARGGKIYWALGKLHFDNVFSDLFRVRAEYGQDPVKYMAEISFPDIMDRSGKFIDTRTGAEVAKPEVNPSMPLEQDFVAEHEFMERIKRGEIKDITPFRPLITTAEIIGFLMGDERKYLDKTTFFDAHHQEVDKADFLAAFSGVLEQLQTRQAELGLKNKYKLERSVYRPLDRYSGYPCGRCDAVFRVYGELEDHWQSHPHHRP